MDVFNVEKIGKLFSHITPNIQNTPILLQVGQFLVGLGQSLVECLTGGEGGTIT